MKKQQLLRDLLAVSSGVVKAQKAMKQQFEHKAYQEVAPCDKGYARA